MPDAVSSTAQTVVVGTDILALSACPCPVDDWQAWTQMKGIPVHRTCGMFTEERCVSPCVLMFHSLLYVGPSLETLHADYANRGRIDTVAAIRSHAEIFIRVPVARVWQILADAPNWQAWMPGVSTVRLEGAVTLDAAFTWKNGTSHIKSTFAVIEPEKELTWTGIAFGAKAVDRHTLEATDGGTRVFTEESMTGLFVTLFFNSQKLRTGQKALLAALKQRAEQSTA